MNAKTLILALAITAICATVASAEIITLADGRVLHVEVLSGDESGIIVRRLDNDGRLHIRWALLREEDRQMLRVRFGFEEDEDDADLVAEGHRIYPRLGDYRDGRVLSQTQEKIVFRQQGKTIEFLPAALRKIEEREVSIFDIYTSEELYEQRATELSVGAATIDGQFDLAKWAMRIGLYEKSMEHLLQVGEMDAEYKADYIKNQLARLEILAKNKEILSAIREAEKEGYSRRFKRCLSIFDEVLGVSDLDADLRETVEKKKARFEKRRMDHFSKLVMHAYHREVNKRIDKYARQRDIRSGDKEKAVTVDKAMAYLRSELHKEIIEYLAQKHELDPKGEVEKMWKERTLRSTRRASYGSGTFIVQKAPKSTQGAGNNGLNKRIQEALARRNNRGRGRQQQQQQQQQPQQKLITKELWWKKVDSTQRAFWMRAWFAENGRQMKVENKHMRNCNQCGATGRLKSVGMQGGASFVTCPRCQGNKGDKVIVYR